MNDDTKTTCWNCEKLGTTGKEKTDGICWDEGFPIGQSIPNTSEIPDWCPGKETLDF